MALSILDGNQSATTLSTIVTSGQHIPAHTVVSLGTQAIANITSAISGTSVCVGSISISGTPSVTGSVSVLNFPASQTTTFGAVTGSVSVLNFPASQSVTFGLVGGTVTANNFTLTNVLQYDGSHYFLKVGGVATTGGTSFPVYVAGSVTANPTGTQTIAGTVTANLGTLQVKNLSNVITSGYFKLADDSSLAVSGMGDDNAVLSQISSVLGLNLSAAVGSLPISGSVTLGAGTAQIGSVTVGNSVTIGSLPSLVAGTANIGVVTVGNIRRAGDGALTQLTTEVGSGALQTVVGAGTNQIGSVTASISGTVPISISSVTVGNSVTIGSLPAISGTVTANTFAVQGTAVTTSNFTSTTPSTVLANYNATREVLTIFNEGAGNLHICAGATCTTIAYQVRLSAGDYYEVPNHQTTITHSAVFATAGTARIVQIS
jgi:hypothetical protein